MRQHLSSTLAVGLSSIHGRGLFLLHPVMQNQMLIEYTGELIRFHSPPDLDCRKISSIAFARPQLADIREKYYMQAEGIDSFYFFRVDDFWIVDATKVLRRTVHGCDAALRLFRMASVTMCRRSTIKRTVLTTHVTPTAMPRY